MNIAGDGHLIEVMQKHRCLWDVLSPQFKMNRLKKEHWMEVAAETGRAVKDVQSRWKNIKDYRAKKLRKPPSGSGARGSSADEKYLRTLSFLDPVVTPRSVLTNIPEASAPGVPEDATPEPSSPIMVFDGDINQLSETQFEMDEDELMLPSPPAARAATATATTTAAAAAATAATTARAVTPETPAPPPTAARPASPPPPAGAASAGQASAQPPRRARPRVGPTPAPNALHGEVVECLKQISEAAKGDDHPDQLFCNSVAAELRRRPADENRLLKAAICRLLYD